MKMGTAFWNGLKIRDRELTHHERNVKNDPASAADADVRQDQP